MRKKNKNKSYVIRRIPGFAWDMPEDCKKCFFWNKDKSKYSLGGFDNCYYRISPPEKKADPCEGCPYGKHRACLGYCTVQVLNYFKERRDGTVNGRIQKQISETF